MTRSRVISNLLIVTALLCATGTDYIAHTGATVRADAMVNVAERMAARFNHAFARKVHQPAMRLAQSRQPAVQWVIDVPPQVMALPTSQRSIPQLLYLPPPALLHA